MLGRRTLELLIGTAVITGAVGVGREHYRLYLRDAPLRQALEQHDLPAALRSIRRGADPNAQASREPTALILAIAHQDSQAVLELLRAGVDPDREVSWWGQPAGYCIPHEREFRHSALSLAVANDDPAMVRLLLRNGADPLRRDSRGKTPAELTDSKRVGELLLAAGVDHQIR